MKRRISNHESLEGDRGWEAERIVARNPKLMERVALLFLILGCIALSACCIERGVVETGASSTVQENFPLCIAAPTGGIVCTATDVGYFENHSPLDFLDELRQHPDGVVTVLDVPDGWITRNDAEELIEFIDSEEPAAPVVSLLSSYMPFNQTSTVGNEALFLLEGYRSGRYPPALCSLYYFTQNRTEMREWWDTYGREGILEERAAISLVQAAKPALRAYPSDQLPPRYMTTEQMPDGWYVAFIQGGSGIAILSAECYYVGNNRTVTQVGVVNQSLMVLPQKFSAKNCS